MALGHLVWITVSACFTVINSLTMQLVLLFWVFALSVSIHFCCNSWPGAGLWSAQTHQASCHISVYSLTRQGVKGGGRCCIDAGGHWGCLLCSLSVWLKFRTWLDQNPTESQQSSCTADLTVHLSSVDCSLDRFVKKVDFFTCFCASDVPW